MTTAWHKSIRRIIQEDDSNLSFSVLRLLPALTILLHATACIAAETTGIPSPETPTLTALTDAQETVSLAATLAKLIGALLLITGIMLLLIRFIRRYGVGGAQTGGAALIKILETRMIAPKKFLALVQVGNENILLGVSDQHVNMLTTISSIGNNTIPSMSAPTENTPFAGMLGKILKRQEQPPSPAATDQELQK